MTLHAEATAAMHAWTPTSSRQARLRDDFLDHLSQHPDGLSRSCAPAHITASAAVLDPAGRRILLVLHSKVGRWLQPGGHCETSDATLAAAALREASEESGIDRLELLLPGIVQVDRHPAPCNPGVVDVHLDVRFVVLAPAGAEPVASPESDDARWFAWDDLPVGLEPTIVDLLHAGRRLIGGP